jgi:hypothetical protein
MIHDPTTAHAYTAADSNGFKQKSNERTLRIQYVKGYVYVIEVIDGFASIPSFLEDPSFEPTSTSTSTSRDDV